MDAPATLSEVLGLTLIVSGTILGVLLALLLRLQGEVNELRRAMPRGRCDGDDDVEVAGPGEGDSPMAHPVADEEASDWWKSGVRPPWEQEDA